MDWSHRSLADCTRAFELTRTQSEAEMPNCASDESNNMVTAWLKKKKKKARKDTSNRCGKCYDIQDMIADTIRQRDRKIDSDYAELVGSKPSGKPLHHRKTDTQ